MKRKLLMITALVVSAALAAAAEEKPLSLAEALDLAGNNNPALLASRQRWLEKQRGIALSAGWPNPELGVMFEDIPAAGGKPMMVEYSLSQEIMFPAKLAAMRNMAKSEAGMAGADFALKQMEIYTSVKQAYYDLLFAQRGLAIMRENLELMRQFNTIAETNYRSGTAPLQDTLRSQTELAKMETEIANMESMEIMAQNKLNYFLGRDSDTPLLIQEEFSNMNSDETADFDIEELRRLAQNNPAVEGMTRELEMSRAKESLAKAAFWPDFKLNFSLVQSTVMDPMLMEMMGGYSLDMRETAKTAWKAGVMVMFPLWFGQYRAQLNAAVSGTSAAEAALADMRNMTGMELSMAVNEARQAFRRTGLYEKTVIPQAEQTWQTVITAYRSGRIDFMTVMDSLTGLRTARLEYYKAHIDYEKALAVLEQIIGRPFFAVGGQKH